MYRQDRLQSLETREAKQLAHDLGRLEHHVETLAGQLVDTQSVVDDIKALTQFINQARQEGLLGDNLDMFEYLKLEHIEAEYSKQAAQDAVHGIHRAIGGYTPNVLLDLDDMNEVAREYDLTESVSIDLEHATKWAKEVRNDIAEELKKDLKVAEKAPRYARRAIRMIERRNPLAEAILRHLHERDPEGTEKLRNEWDMIRAQRRQIVESERDTYVQFLQQVESDLGYSPGDPHGEWGWSEPDMED